VILRAAWVVPVSRPPIRHGFVRLAGAQIAEVGDGSPPAGDGEVLDLGPVALLPGLVNPHTHLELTAYAGQLAPAPFWDWISRLVRLRAAPGQLERERAGVRDGAWQSLRAGVTCVGDISRRNLAWPVLKRMPIRKVCFAELLSLADDPPRNPDELRAGLDAVEEDALLTAGVSPHAPYTVPAEHIRAAVALAHERRRPWCTHWAETPEEVAFLAGESVDLPPVLTAVMARCGVSAPRQAPMAYLASCTAGLGPGLLAHVNYVKHEEIAALASAGHSVVYCPRAHRFFGHEPHPFMSLRRAGVRLCIGTDSSASNENLALLEELAVLGAAVGGALSAEELLRLVTIEAARALGLAALVGSIEPGKQADLAAFPCDAARDPVAALIAQPPKASAVWVAGERVIG
jgi:cytosine/adenosine deaminase-related metal-dependent hydrolase